MALPTAQEWERLLDIGEGLAIYKGHIDCLREQDVNARVMSEQVFTRLMQNIGKDKRLESLPLCAVEEDKEGNKRFAIISGHHRVRAARKAGMKEIYWIADETGLTPEQVKSKQLSHNSLVGYDDPQVLESLYREIEDIDLRIASGITEEDFKNIEGSASIDEVKIDLDYELVNMLFLRSDYEKFEEVLKLLEKDAHVKVADYKDWDKFKETVIRINDEDGIINTAAIMVRMTEIVNEYYDNRPKEDEEEKEE